MLDEREGRVLCEQVGVLTLAGDQAVDADDLMTIGEQPVAQVRADEPCASGDDDAHQAAGNVNGRRLRT